MEYTNDVVFKIRYKKDEIDVVTYGKYRKLKKLLRKIEDDQYFTMVMIISVTVLFVDVLMIKQFIDIVNLVMILL